MTINAMFGWAGVPALILVVHTCATAQDLPVVEVSAGYGFTSVSHDALPRGVFATASWRATGRISLVGEFAAGFDDTDLSRVLVTKRALAFLGGMRVDVSRSRRLEPFVQILAGASRIDFRVRGSSPDPIILIPLDIQLDTIDFAAQLGGGLVWWFRQRVGAQIEAHYQQAFDRFDLGPSFPGHHANEFGLLAGAVIGFGGKP